MLRNISDDVVFLIIWGALSGLAYFYVHYSLVNIENHREELRAHTEATLVPRDP